MQSAADAEQAEQLMHEVPVEPRRVASATTDLIRQSYDDLNDVLAFDNLRDSEMKDVEISENEITQNQ